MKPEHGTLAFGGESIPFTMDADIGHMTMDEAIESGLFEAPDEPGMVSIPISMSVAIPNRLLHPAGLPPEPVSGPTRNTFTCLRRHRITERTSQVVVGNRQPRNSMSLVTQVQNDVKGRLP